jgi:hypothetical protein
MVKMGLWEQENLFLVHIRDFRRSGYGSWHIAEPKGIALTLEVWRKLYEMIHEINDDVEQMASKYQLEGSRYLGAAAINRSG